MSSDKRRVRAWDFGAAKGTGASVVKYDPHADLSQHGGPTSPKRPAPRIREAEIEDTQYILNFWRISKVEALKMAYHLVLTDRHHVVPHDIRIAIARMVLRVGGAHNLSDRILKGDFDNVIGTLLR